MNITQEHLKALAQRAFEDGWNATGQGFNAEHHSLSSEALAQMRDDAVAGRLEELRKELESKAWAVIKWSEFDPSAPGKIVVTGISTQANAEISASTLAIYARGRYSVMGHIELAEQRAAGRVTI